MKPFVKICGLTRPEDGRLAVELGATHLGCIMVPSSPRCATVEQARRVFETADDNVKKVLIFKDETMDVIFDVAREVGTNHVQLYGMTETEALNLEASAFTVYRVHEVDFAVQDLPPFIPEPTSARPAVIDVKGGGAGKPFSWDILGSSAPEATFIAGGVRPENLTDLLKHRPYGIDLSSGVESRPGIKDHDRLRLFFNTLESPL